MYIDLNTSKTDFIFFKVCHFRVGSFNYPTQKITFLNEVKYLFLT